LTIHDSAYSYGDSAGFTPDFPFNSFDDFIQLHRFDKLSLSVPGKLILIVTRRHASFRFVGIQLFWTCTADPVTSKNHL
jgi:hypothetical protein